MLRAPVEMSLGVVIVIAWLLMISGVVQLINAIRGRGTGSRFWAGMIGVTHFGMGLFFRLDLGIGIAALTLALIAFFLAQGIIGLVAYFRVRKTGVSGWLLFQSVMTLILGVMIWRHWPSSSLWVIGMLVGINMIIIGTARLMLALAVRRLNVVPEQREDPNDIRNHVRIARVALQLISLVLVMTSVAVSQGPARIQSLISSGNLAEMRWPNFRDYQPWLLKFYEPAGFAPAWLQGNAPSAQSQAIIELFRNAWKKGLEPEDYDASRWEGAPANRCKSWHRRECGFRRRAQCLHDAICIRSAHRTNQSKALAI